MTGPRKHHYIPTFYLKNWANADGKVCEMRKFPNCISVLRKSPKATGFKKDLYRIEALPDDRAQQFESAFLKLADNDADLALKKILSNDQEPWDARRRSGWSRFISSLFFRNPEVVTEIKDHILSMWKVAVEHLKEEYEFSRKPDDPDTFEEYFDLHHGEIPYVDTANFIKNIIDGGRIAPDIFNLDWSVIDLKNSAFPLLTSDRPLHMPFGLGDPKAFIAIPVGPKKLFVAARDKSFKNTIRSQKHIEIVKRMNKATVAGARDYVWGIDESQVAFVEKHICSVPDRILIGDQAKEKALAAARGELEAEQQAVQPKAR